MRTATERSLSPSFTVRLLINNILTHNDHSGEKWIILKVSVARWLLAQNPFKTIAHAAKLCSCLWPPHGKAATALGFCVRKRVMRAGTLLQERSLAGIPLGNSIKMHDYAGLKTSVPAAAAVPENKKALVRLFKLRNISTLSWNKSASKLSMPNNIYTGMHCSRHAFRILANRQSCYDSSCPEWHLSLWWKGCRLFWLGKQHAGRWWMWARVSPKCVVWLTHVRERAYIHACYVYFRERVCVCVCVYAPTVCVCFI